MLKSITLKEANREIQSLTDLKKLNRVKEIAELPGIEVMKQEELIKRFPEVIGARLKGKAEYDRAHDRIKKAMGRIWNRKKVPSLAEARQLQYALSPQLPKGFPDRDLFSITYICGFTYTHNDARILAYLSENSSGGFGGGPSGGGPSGGGPLSTDFLNKIQNQSQVSKLISKNRQTRRSIHGLVQDYRVVNSDSDRLICSIIEHEHKYEVSKQDILALVSLFRQAGVRGAYTLKKHLVGSENEISGHEYTKVRNFLIENFDIRPRTMVAVGGLKLVNLEECEEEMVFSQVATEVAAHAQATERKIHSIQHMFFVPNDEGVHSIKTEWENDELDLLQKQLENRQVQWIS